MYRRINRLAIQTDTLAKTQSNLCSVQFLTGLAQKRIDIKKVNKSMQSAANIILSSWIIMFFNTGKLIKKDVITNRIVLILQ